VKRVSSLYIKIAGTIFQILGLFTLILTFGFLLKDIEPKEFMQIITQPEIIIPLSYSILYTLIGFFLKKRHYWAYICGLILTILPLLSYIYILIRGETPILIQPLLLLAILTLLILGRDEFNREKNF